MGIMKRVRNTGINGTTSPSSPCTGDALCRSDPHVTPELDGKQEKTYIYSRFRLSCQSDNQR